MVIFGGVKNLLAEIPFVRKREREEGGDYESSKGDGRKPACRDMFAILFVFLLHA